MFAQDFSTPITGKPERDPLTESDRARCYKTRAAGVLEQDWQDWFDGMSISIEGNTTVLTGLIVDQPALYGMINKLRDLGLSLISVSRLEDAETTIQPIS